MTKFFEKTLFYLKYVFIFMLYDFQMHFVFTFPSHCQAYVKHFVLLNSIQ